MFERPIKTLKHSLFKVLENAEEYVADVCFEYPNNTKIWAHKAILTARVPEAFRLKYLPELSDSKVGPLLTFNLSVVIPYTTLRQLLRFWYIGEFSAPLDDASLISSDVSGLSEQEASSILQKEVETKIKQEIKALEEKIGLDLLPRTNLPGPTANTDQLTNDLKTMLDNHVFSDVTINIFNVPHKNHTNMSNTTVTTSPTSAHRFILASQSPYFYSAFCTEFREASTSSIHLPSDLFSSSTLQVILYYFYTDTLILPPIANIANKTQARVNEKKHELRILQRVFTAADYLGHYNTICKAVLLKMAVICHQFKCVCNDCAILLPSMLLFADKNEKYVPQLRQALVALYADPLDSLAPLWSQKPFAILVGSFTQQQQQQQQQSKPSHDANTETISKIFSKSSSSSTSTVPSTDTASSSSIEANSLIQEITERTFANMTKHNCVRALHSLHLCLSQLRGADPFPTWSQPVLSILNQFLHHTIDMISNNFDYYCVEYPILLSCVDGIGFGFSVDFLGFVLTRILTEGIHDGNAAIIYQGIVRDLGGRQEMVKNVAVDGVLFDARLKCAQYLSKRWTNVKAEGGFNTIEKEILRFIAEDINVPVRSLSKPMENENFKFSFKPKKSSNTAISKAVQKEEANLSNATKRLSLGSTDETQKTRIVRTRSLSASSSTAPESILRKDTQYHHSSDTEEMISSGLMRRKNSRQYKRQDSTGSLTDALLPIDTVTTTEKKEETNTPRPTRLRFALPDTPSRVPRHQNFAQKSSAKKNKKRAKSPGKSRWGLGYSTSDSSDDEATQQVPKVGYKVELLRRPLPTQGTIKYIGPVDFANGTWVGVELESRLGNNDGSVDGKRYFQTFPQRGVFIKIDDFKIISTGEKK